MLDLRVSIWLPRSRPSVEAIVCPLLLILVLSQSGQDITHNARLREADKHRGARRYDCHWAWSAPSLHVQGSNAAVDGTTWGQAVQQDVITRFIANGTNGTAMRPGSPSGDNVSPFQMGCSGATHPASHRYSVHWCRERTFL